MLATSEFQEVKLPLHFIKLETPFYLPDFPSSQRHVWLSEIFPHKNMSWDMALSSFSSWAFLSSPLSLSIFTVEQSGRTMVTTKLSPEAAAVWACQPWTLVTVWLWAWVEQGHSSHRLSLVLITIHQVPLACAVSRMSVFYKWKISGVSALWPNGICQKQRVYDSSWKLSYGWSSL